MTARLHQIGNFGAATASAPDIAPKTAILFQLSTPIRQHVRKRFPQKSFLGFEVRIEGAVGLP
jgi:hypothetical protein